MTEIAAPPTENNNNNNAAPKPASRKINLKSGDGHEFSVEYDIIKMSGTIKGIVGDIADEDGQLSSQIPMANITGKTLGSVIQYCEHCKGVPPADPMFQSVEINGWDKSFIESFDQPELFRVILGANYMEVPSLIDLGCKRVAHMIKDKSEDEIMKIFNISRTFTKEEIKKAMRDPAYIYDPSLPKPDVGGDSQQAADNDDDDDNVD